jgi:hypothetical protein
MRFARIGFLAVLALGLLAACATQTTSNVAEAPGFWLGLMHGFILPFALIAELFTNAHVYAFPNSGGWYDLGFVLGAAAIFGGGGSQARPLVVIRRQSSPTGP